MNAPNLKMRIYPDPILRKRAPAIKVVGDEEKEIMSSMVEIMHANQGIGLAAPQIGVAKRIIVVDAGDGLLKMANPKIVSKKGISLLEEGCLSLPRRGVEVERAQEISVSYMDETSEGLVKDFKGMTARGIQHEIDHLNGKLIIDYLPWYRRIFSKRKEAKCLQ